MTKNDQDLLGIIERYLDAVPLSASYKEQVGKFTLFRPTGPWKYYARPHLGMNEDITAADVDELRARQRELELPQNIEWVVQTTPTLASAAAASGLGTVEYPLLVLDDDQRLARALEGADVRQVNADDSGFAQAHAVANVGFGAEGTAVGTEGAAERDTAALEMTVDRIEFMRDRHRRAVSVTYAAFDDSGPVAVGTHQPLDGVTEIVGVATLPVARRRGLGAAVTAALVRDALERGVTTVFLSAGSDDVARVYERVGFRRIGAVGGAEPGGGH